MQYYNSCCGHIAIVVVICSNSYRSYWTKSQNQYKGVLLFGICSLARNILPLATP